MRYAILFAAALQLVPSQLAGQRGAAPRETDCRTAERVIATGNPPLRVEWALEQLSSCPENGPRVAAGLWRAAPSDTAGVTKLRWVTQELRDQRLADALLEIAGDASRASVVRTTAMLHLLTYAEPSDATRPGDLVPSDGYTWAAADLAHPIRHQDGTVPLRATYRDELAAFFRQVEEADPDPSMRYAGGVLAAALDRRAVR